MIVTRLAGDPVGTPLLSHAQLDRHLFDVVGRACRLALWSGGSVEQTGLTVGEPPLVPPGQSGAIILGPRQTAARTRVAEARMPYATDTFWPRWSRNPAFV